MPTYKAPGVYVEEARYTAKAIEGQSTSVTAFVGLTAWGAMEPLPLLITTFADYQRLYGPAIDLHPGGTATPNYMAHAARAFFNNGGTQLHIVRIASAGARPAEWACGPGDAIKLIARTPGGSDIGATFAIIRTPLGKALALRQPAGTMIEALGETYVIDPGTQAPALAALPDDVALTCVTLRITITAPGGATQVYDQIAFDARHPRALQAVLGAQDPTADLLVRCEIDPAIDPIALRDALETAASATLTGGSDGDLPSADDWNAGMGRLGGIDDISIIAAPGSSALPGETPRLVTEALIALTNTPATYRFAVLDAPPALGIDAVLQFAQPFDTKNAALYYPWVMVTDPANAAVPLALPPSGFVCGIYARNDVERGVAKAPANLPVTGALGLAIDVTSPQQNALDPKGINCIRFFAGRGIRVWGARTLSSDPEWKYVSQRRYFLYLERSIDRGIAWAAFEPNGDRLWAALSKTITDFLMNEWINGALLGAKPGEAFFARCDRSTMTQADLDAGRVIALIGVATVKPAEFVIFRVGVTIGVQGG